MHKQDADTQATTPTRAQLEARFARSFDGRGFVASVVPKHRWFREYDYVLCRVLGFGDEGEARIESVNESHGGFDVIEALKLQPLHETKAALIKKINTYNWPEGPGGMRGLRALIRTYGPIKAKQLKRIGNLMQARPFTLEGVRVRSQWADYASVLQVRLTNAAGQWCVLERAMYEGVRGHGHVFVRTQEHVCSDMLGLIAQAMAKQGSWMPRKSVPALALGDSEMGGSMARK